MDVVVIAENNNSAGDEKPTFVAEPKKTWTHGGGRHKRSRNQNRNGGSEKNMAGERGNYELPGIVTTNESLFRYYEQQGVIPSEEWEQFKAILPVPLPSSFRIQRSLPERDLLLEYMRSNFFVEIERIQRDGSAPGVDAPKPLPFVPYAFQTEMPRAAVRSHPVLADLHEFLVNETAIGNISRQEAVSMVPPLLLDIQSHHLVFDACASPGSKTMQIVELMHENNPKPEGLVVANDIEYERCYLLVHQTLKRLPTANCVVINEDAAQMPAIVDDAGKPVLYDRILCDVICSSDGTFRKNPELWTNWDPQKSLHLHKVQQNIARRCIRLLKVGGLMVYSTCSLNPIEDEAVVAHMLRVFNGCVELVDVSDKLPGLRRSAGVSTWKVFNRKLEEMLSMDGVPSEQCRNFVPSMFPPTAAEAADMHLDRSFRILPHAQNSGGFFVAVFRKTAPTSFVDEDGRELTAVRCHATKNQNAAKRNRRAPAPREDPFIFFEEAEGAKLSAELLEHYGIEPTAVPSANLLVRKVGAERKNAIYYVNDRLRDFLKLNAYRLKIVNAGVQLLRRVEKVSRCGFRLCQDGLGILAPHVTKRILLLPEKDFIKVLLGSDDDQYLPWEVLDSREQFHNLDSGSVILTIEKGALRKNVCAWMGARTVSAFINREDKIHILELLGADSSKLRSSAKSSRQQKAAGDRAAARKIAKLDDGPYGNSVIAASQADLDVDE